MAGIMDFLFGSGDSYSLPRDTQKYIKQLRKQLPGQVPFAQDQPGFQTGQNYLQQLFEPGSESMQAFQQPTIDQFQQQIIPQIAERFALGDEKGSSGFQNALSGAAANLSAMLGQQREGLKQQSLGQLLNYAQTPFQQYGQIGSQISGAPYNYQQGDYGLAGNTLSTLLQQLAKGGGQALSSYMGGGF